MKNLARQFFAALVLFSVVLLSACASGPRIVDHAFGFDALTDSPTTEILAYRYGSSDQPFLSSTVSVRQFGKSSQGTNINGSIPLGDFLYVKWRIKSTGQEFEDTVDLKSRLPWDVTNQRIHFVVQGTQLLVYLIDPVPRPANWPVIGPRKYQYEKVRQIYPNAPPN